ncbi:DUF4394 domain-containing protein [Hansschlegelia sp. KR7-227]|uniref:DUF4394 domain-containing protein n=1 Tax=Hansschlegelia sp. KR7-227 TaxID=3400914 RepID=UPI003C0B858E
MTPFARSAIALAACSASALCAAPAAAESLIALSGAKSLTVIDPDSLKTTAKMDVTGVESLVGVDVRPADGMLYGLTATGDIVTIDMKTGAAAKKSALSEKLADGATVTVDFNPAADRLRVMTDKGVNLRVNVDDGKATVDGPLKFAEKDMHKGETPNVVAGAYTNSITGKKPEKTALYDIDATIPALLMQAPPNDGVLSAIGKLGVSISGPVAFNIVTGDDGATAAWLVTGGALYSVDLATGKTREAGKLDVAGDIIDIAWAPAK